MAIVRFAFVQNAAWEGFAFSLEKRYHLGTYGYYNYHFYCGFVPPCFRA